ncbi:hypothetical protein [Aestuariibaculum sediminum]|uniref:Uncharacterized protein n=1 Tax=Aestuariibaculum sediminum TaxID=2770637 RepID=A0A8J6Q2M1_9FLAO|nr:hypothetical protein [Aestuariibaculum sediminum]MBD0832316.1 hypothetical protein [Aestuariibaculum sediminum]
MNHKKQHRKFNSGFNIPEDYFDGFEDRLFSQINLKTKANDSGFNIPENYLDDLEDRILHKVSTTHTPKVVPLFSRKNVIYASSIAACIILMFSLSIFKTNNTFDNIDSESIEEYLFTEDLDVYEIASNLSSEDFAADNYPNIKIDEETFEDYILIDVDIEDMVIE